MRVHGVAPQIRRLFEELSMDAVVGQIDEGTMTLPDEWVPLPQSKMGGDSTHLRLLRAHEVLASLSDRNREEFLAVVEALRAELQSRDR